jgi:hypothetical protein
MSLLSPSHGVRRPDCRQQQSHTRTRGRVLTGVLLCCVLLAGCAPDAWRPDNPYDAFLDQVQRKCGDERIGSKSISGDFLQEGDAYFLDLTSRYYHREITEQDYVDALTGAYGARPDAPGLRCLLSVQRNPLPAIKM